MNTKELLEQVAQENVSWTCPGRRGTTYKLWTSERDYIVITRQMKKLVPELVKCCMTPGYTYITRGYCVLTRAGIEVLQ